MIFEDIVEIKTAHVWSSGNCDFWAKTKKQERSSPFKIKYNIGTRVPQVGEMWKVKGQIKDYDKYNKQVVVSHATLQPLPSNEYVSKFLGSHPNFRGFGFGERTADNLVEDIGAEELCTLLNKGDWKAICDARISESKAKRICEEWQDLKEEAELATFLTEHKLDGELSRQIIRLCKYNTLARLKRNPYALIGLSNTSEDTLRTIDAVAKSQKIKPNDDRALIGSVEFVLYQQLQYGNTITEINSALESINSCLGMINSEQSPEIAVEVALMAKAICIYEDDTKTYLQPISLAYIEQSVEKALISLHQTPIQDCMLSTLNDLKERIQQYSIEHKNMHGWGLVDKQCEAVKMALTQRVSLLSGYGGTGKTAVLRAVYELAIEKGITVHVAALAGKAADRARQSIGADDKKVSTLHSMIKLLEKKNNIGVDITSDPLLIIDESSMIDISLICKLIKLFESYPFRILLVGDGAQLPPIGFGLFFHRLIESNAPHTKLTEVHRTVSGSAIHECAMKIRNGEPHNLPIYEGQTEGVYVMPNVIDYTTSIVKLRKSFSNFMVLTSYASNSFKSSTNTLNPLIQQKVNPPFQRAFTMQYGTVILRQKDPVLATKNVHAMGIFNGMTGIVKSIQTNDGKIVCNIQFDGKSGIVPLTKEECWEIGLQLAYLITIHKSQGSEYDNCAILIDSKMIERSALYTALTRAKKLCILIGNNTQYNNAIKRPPSYKAIRAGFSPVFEDTEQPI